MPFAATAALTEFWAKCKAAFAAVSHNHAASDITSGTLAEARGGTGYSSFATAFQNCADSFLTDYGPLIFQDDDTWTVDNLGVAYGGTGSTNAAGARANLGFGEVKTASSASVSAASASNVNLRSISLTAGTWMVCGRAQWPSSTTGRRAAKLSTTSADSSNCVSTTSIAPVSGATTQLSVTRFFKLTATTTVYLIGYHNIGSAQTCYGEIEAVRIG